MDWPIIEVAVGLAFFFWLMSILAAAINELVASAFRLRSAGLERGLRSMLGQGHAQQFLQTATVLSQRKRRRNGTPGRQPSYLAATLFGDAMQELFGTPDDAFRLDLSKIEFEPLRTRLETLADKVGDDGAKLRKEVEVWFDETMDRVSGWYKRQSQIILLVIGILLAVGANLSTVGIGERLWSDSSFRAAVNAEASQAVAAGTIAPATTTPTVTTTPSTTPGTTNAATTTTTTPATTTPPGPLQRAEADLDAINRLDFPAGWGDTGRPNGAGWAAAVLGWLLTAFAVTLGAPFWFDVLNKAVNLRGTGPPPPTTPDPDDATKDPTGGAGTAAASSAGPARSALANRMPTTDRAAVVVSALSIAGDAKYAALYRALDLAGPAIVDAELHDRYGRVDKVTGDECTRAGIVAALTSAAQDCKAVDLVLMVHGEENTVILADGNGGTVTVPIFELSSDLAHLPDVRRKLRLCYSTACYGLSHAQALLGAGFDAAIGAKKVNTNSATELPILLRHWVDGDSIGVALRRADNPALRFISDSIARASFSDVNSEKVLLGDSTLTIDSPPRQG